MGRLVLLLSLVAACRYDFASDAPELDCAQPSRFSIGGTISKLTAAATPGGYAVFAVDTSGKLTGSTFDFPAAQPPLTATVEGAVIDVAANGTLGTVTQGSQIMLASVFGMPTALGTSTYLFGPRLAAAGATVERDNEIAGPGPIAEASNGDTRVLLTITGTTVQAQRISATGANAGSMVTLLDGSDAPSGPSIKAGGPGYVLAWTATAGSPNVNKVALLDANLKMVAGPVTTDHPAGLDEETPEIAWAPQSNTYLVAWLEKASKDQVWAALLGSNLETITPPTIVSGNGSTQRIASDGTGFWMAYKDRSATPYQLGGIYFGPDGSTGNYTVQSSGGTPLAWTLVDRNDQVGLIWVESGGSGPNLWLAGLCR